MTNKELSFHLKDDENFKYAIPKDIMMSIYDYNEVIFTTIFSNQTLDFQKTRRATLEAYFDSWLKKEIPEIREDNYIEMYQLSMAFGYLVDYFRSSDQHNLPILGLISASNNEILIDRSLLENNISLHLDENIKNYPNDLKKVPFTSLYNIFNKEERVLNDHDQAYHFIVETAEETDKQTFFVLLETLDSFKFKEDDNKIDAFNNKNKHYGFLPQNSGGFDIDNLIKLRDEKKKNEDIQTQLNEFKQTVDSLNNELQKAKQEIEDLKAQLNNLNESKIHDLEEKNKELEERMKRNQEI